MIDEIDAEIEEIERELERIQKQNMNFLSSDEIEKQDKAIKKLKNRISELICILEVEHFLEVGPCGKDPE